MKKYSNIGFVFGGSFQGKSLLAIRTAAECNYSAIISTDTVRNILCHQHPDDPRFGSPSSIPIDFFEYQCTQVCGLLKSICDQYSARGERVIVEGIHVTEEFISHILNLGGRAVALNNTLSWERKVKLKSITRTKMKVQHSGGSDFYAPAEAVSNSSNAYILRQEVFKKIHDRALSMAKKKGVLVIEYSSLESPQSDLIKIFNPVF